MPDGHVSTTPVGSPVVAARARALVMSGWPFLALLVSGGLLAAALWATRASPTRPIGGPELRVVRTAGAQIAPLGREMAASDGLSFGYANPGTDYGYLMIYAVDHRGQLHWYYPAHQNPAENPAAIPIERVRASAELREIIRQPLAPGRLELHALFLSDPLSVREVESARDRHAAPAPTALERTWIVNVTP
jgi:hypothetical protein